MWVRQAKAELRKCLAAGADELVFLEEEAFDNLYGNATAHILAAAITKMGNYDLILAGRQAADTDSVTSYKGVMVGSISK